MKVRAQETVWKVIRELKTFSRADLIIAVNKKIRVCDRTVDAYVTRLKRGGFLEVSSKDNSKYRNCAEIYTYTLIKDNGVEAPSLKANGEMCDKGRKQENMWRAIRMLKDFDAKDLVMTASTPDLEVKLSHSRNYIKSLLNAKYIFVSKPHDSRGGLARYRLIPAKNTGPLPPRIRKVTQLFDPNIGEVVWPIREEETEEEPC